VKTETAKIQATDSRLHTRVAARALAVARRPAAWLSVLFVASRAVIFVTLAGRSTDLGVHAGYVARIVHGELPFRDFVAEYPPLVFVFTAVPAIFDRSLHYYFPIFRALCCCVDCGMWALLLALHRKRVWPCVVYVLCTTALGPLLYDRIDIVLGAILLVAASLLLRRRDGWSCLAVGLGIAFKLIPIVLAPAILVTAWRRGWLGLAGAALLLSVPAVVSVDLTIAMGGRQLEGLMDYHQRRGVHLESVPGSVEMVMMHLTGAPGAVSTEYGSVNLHTRYEPVLLRVSTLLLVGMMLGAALLAGTRRRDLASLLALLATALCASLLFSKVLSPQYFIFLLPVLVALPPMRGWVERLTFWAIVLATYGLTAAVFPWNFDGLMRLEAGPETLLIARNLCLAGLTATLFYNYLKLSAPLGPERGADGAAPDAQAKTGSRKVEASPPAGGIDLSNETATARAPDISIIVPTINEADNLPPLLARIAAALAGTAYEVLVIDDGSTDGTEQVCRRLAESRPIRLHIRQEPVGGLSGAVVRGFALARGEVLVVMDADLQHPPEALPSLVAPLLAGTARMVIGSRHVAGGRIAGEWGIVRRLNSTIARILARPLIGPIRDPMSGFFALRRETWAQARRLRPAGYKIALEIMCRCPVGKVVEVPIDFSLRAHGHSKLNLTQQITYLMHLGRLYAARLAPRPVK
jgi:hypothetical protein